MNLMIQPGDLQELKYLQTEWFSWSLSESCLYFPLHISSNFPVEISLSCRPFGVCFPITSAAFNFDASYVFNLAKKPILLRSLYDLMALEPKM